MALPLGVALVLLLLTVVVVLELYRRTRPDYQLIERLGGPSGLPGVGHGFLGLFTHKQREQYFLSKAKLFPRLFRVWIGPTMPTVGMYHPELTAELFKSTKNITKGYSYDFLHEWIGTGLLTATGDKWKARRHLITPSFHFEVLKGFVEVFRDQAKVLVDVLARHADTGKSVNVFPLVTRCALDIICESAMGQSVNAQAQPNNAYVTAVLDMSRHVFNRALSPWQWNDFVYKTFFPSGRAYVRDLHTLHSFTRSVIRQRRQQIAAHGGVDANKPRQAFLDMLITTIDENGQPLTDDDIHEEVETFMFEGHDTTAAAMTWALFNIAKCPRVQKKVHEELDAVLGSRSVPSYEDLSELPYLELCIKESLRLHPSVPMIARRLDEDFVADGLVIPKGTQVALLIIAQHRLPSLWGDDADVYRPERFESKDSSGANAFSYVPFSGGSRNCIGQRFALYEERTVLAAVLKNYEIELDTAVPEPDLQAELILRPSNGVHLKLKRRTL